MLITIRDVDLTHPQPVGGSSSIGYWVEFDSDITQAAALFVPRNRDLADLVHRQFDVATRLEAVSDFRTLPQAGEFQLTPLPARGDFSAVGQVVSIVWLDDAGEYSVAEVRAGPCRFEFPLGQWDDEELSYGQWVAFHIHQLSLWDEGI